MDNIKNVCGSVLGLGDGDGEHYSLGLELLIFRMRSVLQVLSRLISPGLLRFWWVIVKGSDQLEDPFISVGLLWLGIGFSGLLLCPRQ